MKSLNLILMKIIINFLQNHGMLIASNDIDEVLEEIYYFEDLFLEIIGINKNNLYIKVELEGVLNDGFYEYKFKGLDKQKIINDRIFFQTMLFLLILNLKTFNI